VSRPKNELKQGPVGTFDPALFRKAIQALGLEFRWSRAVECPCRLEGSDQFKPDCQRCGSDGWWYVSPEEKTDRHSTLDYVTVKATFSQASIRPDMYKEFGGWDAGEATMTAQPEMRVGYRDRLIAMQQEMPWTELLIKSAVDLIPVGKTTRTTGEQLSAMRYEPVRINFIADENDVRYWQDTHWRLRESTSVEPARLEWLNPPAIGVRYTIHYTARPVWIVDDATYAIQGLSGPDASLKGIRKPQVLPSTFKVKLDFLTMGRGT